VWGNEKKKKNRFGAGAVLCCLDADDVESHQLVIDTMPLMLTMFTRGRHSTSPASSTHITMLQLLRTLSLVCHRNRVAQVSHYTGAGLALQTGLG